jgi:hypothetical protein
MVTRRSSPATSVSNVAGTPSIARDTTRCKWRAKVRGSERQLQPAYPRRRNGNNHTPRTSRSLLDRHRHLCAAVCQLVDQKVTLLAITAIHGARRQREVEKCPRQQKRRGCRPGCTTLDLRWPQPPGLFLSNHRLGHVVDLGARWACPKVAPHRLQAAQPLTIPVRLGLDQLRKPRAAGIAGNLSGPDWLTDQGGARQQQKAATGVAARDVGCQRGRGRHCDWHSERRCKRITCVGARHFFHRFLILGATIPAYSIRAETVAVVLSIDEIARRRLVVIVAPGDERRMRLEHPARLFDEHAHATYAQPDLPPDIGKALILEGPQLEDPQQPIVARCTQNLCYLSYKRPEHDLAIEIVLIWHVGTTHVLALKRARLHRALGGVTLTVLMLQRMRDDRVSPGAKSAGVVVRGE